MRAPLRITAVGDIAFEGRFADTPVPNFLALVQEHLSDGDLVIGNLECALLNEGTGIPGKCTLRGNPGWAAALRSGGLGLVTLANNHIMDFGPDGLLQTLQALESAGIRYVGAGRNRSQAYAPLILSAGARRIAVLARSAVVVSAPTEATDTSPGIAQLDSGEMISAIRAARADADLVVLLLHWGIEEYLYPSPMQRTLARSFIEAGAGAIIGHHPHVLQGIEYFHDAPVLYSLGNFVFDEFEWECVSAKGTPQRQFSPLSPSNRRSVIARIEWGESTRPAVHTTFTQIGSDARPELDVRPERGKEFGRLSARLQRKAYAPLWRLYSMNRERQLRLGDRMSLGRVLRNLHRLRPQHVAELFQSLRRSARIVAEKTSNPYE